MHNLHRIFGRRNNSSAPMDPSRSNGLATRRLERRDALKRVDYDAASSCSSAEDLSVSPPASSLFTRSLDLPPPTSFRIGGGEGEMDRICQTLGISSPDDFGIPLEMWEASRKRSSSDLLPRIKSMGLDSQQVPAEEVSEGGSCRAVAGSSADGEDTEAARPESSKLNEPCDCSTSGRGDSRDEGLEGGSSHVGLTRTGVVESTRSSIPATSGGIKGIRPPPVLKPPPAMKLPPIDMSWSSWDILRDFAPNSVPGRFPEVNQRPVSSSSSDHSDDENEADEAVFEETEKRETEADRHDKAIVLQSGDAVDESRLFTTNDCDTPSTMSNTSPNYPSMPIITDWQKGQRLGQGSFGTVYEGIAGDGDFIAIKEVSLLDQGSQAQECIQQLEREIAILSQLNHPNIVRYRGTCRDGSNLYIFLELVKGSLLNLYRTYQLGDSQVSAYTRQILCGLKFLHDRNFIHRDIKCANILVDTDGSVKLADFGLAKVTKLNDIKSCKGTPFWMAPEVINRKTNDGYGCSADIWSLGCTVLEMLTGQIPYSDLEQVSALFRIGKGVLPSVPDTLSPEAREFIFRCLKVKPEERPTATELLNHPFVRRPLQPASSGSGSGSASPHLRGRV
ncbi:PREDICTED: mitogen-activated protein kinase kinase kinase 1-like [Tarenaya hassleriana]|uniref:mitogen-activated protein kinase kinase kinase 1-like n=1 Tax=Tarenaya hassleriana TaxID=28532 RepID=UPI00053C60AD|nr:PREDICTED: mitogen-activated protein kinase kinase kinase 1-like [Tarenaya hassleriana]XP_010544376.1 PREDICTED: mitogen-activated protein kinase kinase kinase 1-like [Tarenaya hassleriana]